MTHNEDEEELVDEAEEEPKLESIWTKIETIYITGNLSSNNIDICCFSTACTTQLALTLGSNVYFSTAHSIITASLVFIIFFGLQYGKHTDVTHTEPH